MRKKLLALVFVAAGLMFSFNLGIASACPNNLECSNFTDSDKISNCNYATSQGFNSGEEQEILCVLWDDSYDFEQYEFPAYELDTNLSMSYNEIDTARFILAGKIFIFGIFNYLLFSLTKLSSVVKWLTAVS